jgi:hypothetical protein
MLKEDNMNVKDIKTAIIFMIHCNYDKIYLQCKTARDIPYVKRELAHMLGDPSKVIDNTFYYTIGMITFAISMVPLSKDLTGADESRVFYVAYKDDSDWNELCAEKGVKQRLVPYTVEPWVTVSDLYTWLVRDGYKGEQALHMMKCDGLI